MKISIRRILLLVCAATVAADVSVYAMEKSPGEWIADANRILKVDPQNAKAYYNRGTGHYGEGEYEAAVIDLSTAITLESEAPDAYFNRGLSYRKQHKMDAAISDFSKAITLYPGQSGYYLGRCNAFIVKGELEGAIADCSEVIRLSPDETKGYFLRGVARMLSGDLDGALVDSVQALQIQPDHPDIRRLLYETLIKRYAVIDARNATPQYEKKIENAVNMPEELLATAFNTEKK